MTMRCPVGQHDIEALDKREYHCVEHGLTVLFHDPGPSLEFPSRSRLDERSSPLRGPGSGAGHDGPVYIAQGTSARYHEAEDCYTLGRVRPKPVVLVVSRSKAESNGRTPCGHCSRTP